MPRFDDVVVADDRGTRYTFAFGSGHIPRGEPGQVRGLMELRFSLDPSPRALKGADEVCEEGAELPGEKRQCRDEG